MERMLGAAGRARPPASKHRHREPIRPGNRGVAQSGRLPLEPISRKRSAKTVTIIVVRPRHTENPVSIVFADFRPAYFAACLLGAAEKQELIQTPKLALSVFTSSNRDLVEVVEALPAQRYCLPALHFERLAHTHPPISLHF